MTTKPKTTAPAPAPATDATVSERQRIGYEARKRALELSYRQEAPLGDSFRRAEALATYMLGGIGAVMVPAPPKADA